MKTRIAFGLTGVVAATMCSMVLAQDDKAQTPQPQTPRAAVQAARIALKPGAIQIDVSHDKDGTLLDIHANEVNAAVLFRAIAEKTDLKILVSDDVGEMRRGDDVNDGPLLVSTNLVQVPLKEVLKMIASASSLELGKVGDTYLVVRSTRRSFILRRESVQKVPAPAPQFNPGQNPQAPRNWGAFPFNGDNIYVVPLGDADKNRPIVDRKIEAKVEAPTPVELAQGKIRIDLHAASSLGAPLFDIQTGDVDVVSLLTAVAEKANFKLLVGDDVREVRRMRFSVTMKQIAPAQALRSIAQGAHLKLSQTGDIYLVTLAAEPATYLPQGIERIPQPRSAPHRSWRDAERKGRHRTPRQGKGKPDNRSDNDQDKSKDKGKSAGRNGGEDASHIADAAQKIAAAKAARELDKKRDHEPSDSTRNPRSGRFFRSR